MDFNKRIEELEKDLEVYSATVKALKRQKEKHYMHAGCIGRIGELF